MLGKEDMSSFQNACPGVSDLKAEAGVQSPSWPAGSRQSLTGLKRFVHTPLTQALDLSYRVELPLSSRDKRLLTSHIQIRPLPYHSDEIAALQDGLSQHYPL